jgi:ABC-2 type transport system permease protein
MDASAATIAPFKYQRWLPYWSVLQTDMRQILRSWVYRLWVAVIILAAAGFLVYRFGVHREAGIVQPSAVHTSDLFRGVSLGSLALIVVLTVSSISSERGTLADSVLSRGISRYQYFLAKCHARTLIVVLTFSVLASIMLFAFNFLLADDLSLIGCLAAVLTISALLAAVVSVGVAVGGACQSTVVGITLLWIVLYGSGILMSLLPSTFPTPEKVLARLPKVLCGQYDLTSLWEWVLGAVIVAWVSSIVGMLIFARKDV